jgi:hypothetical protein
MGSFFACAGLAFFFLLFFFFFFQTKPIPVLSVNAFYILKRSFKFFSPMGMVDLASSSFNLSFSSIIFA